MPGWSRVKMLRTNARSIGHRLFARYSASRFLRSANVGLPSPVHTSASRARRWTRRDAFAQTARAKRARRRAVDRSCLSRALLQDVSRSGGEIIGTARHIGIHQPPLVRMSVAFAIDAPGVVTAASKPVHGGRSGLPGSAGRIPASPTPRPCTNRIVPVASEEASVARDSLAACATGRGGCCPCPPACTAQCSVPLTSASAWGRRGLLPAGGRGSRGGSDRTDRCEATDSFAELGSAAIRVARCRRWARGLEGSPVGEIGAPRTVPA